MILINKVPILVHLINHFKKYGFNEFIIASGYKSKVIKNYFKKKKFKACKIDMKSSECYIKAPRGRIRVKDVSWSGAVFKNTSVPESLYTGKLADVASSIDTKALQSQLKEAETALSAELESFGSTLQDFL